MPSLSQLSGSLLEIVLAAVFVVANAFFVAAEFALVKVRGTRLEILAKRGNPLAKMSEKMVENLDPYLSATQLGVTLSSLGLGWVGEPAFADIISYYVHAAHGSISPTTLHSLSLTTAFMFISALHIVLGELVPKSLAIRHAETVCLFIAPALRIFYFIFFPFLWVLNGSSNFILKLLGSKLEHGPGRAHSEEEIKLIVEDSYEEGVIGARKLLLLEKAIDFSHKTVGHIMIPAASMVCIYLSESLHSNLERVREAGHTRFPLLDKPDGSVLGFIHMKDIIWHLENQEVINLFDLCRPILFFPPETKLDNALREFQRKAVHMGVVQTQKGVVYGLLTLEDVIEQLVGAIADEFDETPKN